ncbi:MAG: PKD domain-containing protein, partial [bacterium]
GYTGRLLILADRETQQFYGPSVRTDPTLVKNADGYIRTGDLLATTDLLNNTFPYVLLADDGEDNRLNDSNGENPVGNYDRLLGGWQQENIVTGTGWTGYDYIHGGQAIQNSVTFRREALALGAYRIRVALLVKWTDPRGVLGRSRRFPALPADPLLFAYRLPFAALDVSKSVVTSPHPQYEGTLGSAAPIAVSVRDWDATATEAPTADLSGEPQVELIEPGASGAPSVEIDAPALTTSPQVISFIGAGDGLPSSELGYAGSLTQDIPGAPAGYGFALIRITDPANSVNDDGYHFGVDPTTIQPSAIRALDSITYQAVRYFVVQNGELPVITRVDPQNLLACPGARVTFVPTVAGVVTSWAWDFGGGALPNTSTDPTPTVTLQAAGIYQGTVTASNGAGSSAPFLFTYTVDPGAPGWNFHQFNSGSDQTGFVCDVDVFDGRPVVTSLRWDGASYHLEVSLSAVDIPSAPTDWTSYEITSFFGTQPIVYQPAYQTMLVHNGRICIVFNDQSTQRLMLAASTVVAPTLPGPGDWNIHEIDPPTLIGPGRHGGLTHSITVHNGLLAVAYRDASSDDLNVALATADPPVSPSDWAIIPAEHVPGRRGSWADIVSYDDGTPGGPKLYVAHRQDQSYFAHISQCLVNAPSAANAQSEWIHYDIGTQFGGRAATLLPITRAGQPRLALVHLDWNQPDAAVKFCVTNVQHPTGQSDWTQYDIEIQGQSVDEMNGTDMVQSNGVIYICFYRNDGDEDAPSGRLGIARALNDQISGPGDWDVTFPDTTGGLCGYFPRMVVLPSGRIAVVHRYGHRSITPGAGYGPRLAIDACP